jgi:hypothetical protein
MIVAEGRLRDRGSGSIRAVCATSLSAERFSLGTRAGERGAQCCSSLSSPFARPLNGT